MIVGYKAINYDMDVKHLKRVVHRNIDRFFDEFMIELNKEEVLFKEP